MTKLFKNENIFTVVALLTVFTVGCIVLPLAINLFFKGLLFIMTEPVTALIYTSIFLGGMVTNEILDKLDK
jgi:hypothetical protein